MKTAVVLGSCRPGIGEAVTRRLVSDGYVVYGSYEAEYAQNLKSLDDLGDRATFVQVDHSDLPSLERFTADTPFPKVDTVVVAEFFFSMEDPDSFDHGQWHKSLFVNLTVPNFVYHSLKARLSKGASFVVITSTEGFTGSFGASAYASTKAAIHNLVKSLANNEGARGIRVNAVAAGWIGGVMDTDEVFNMSRRITPLGRLGAPEEIAAVVSFLIGKESSFVNGTVIVADGGYSGVDTIAKYEFEKSQEKHEM